MNILPGLPFKRFSNFFSIAEEENKKIIEKKFEGINFPVQILKNELISKNSIFVLEHKPGAIIEIENFNEENIEPKINTILNLETLVTEVDNWEPGVVGFAFSPFFKKDKLIFVTYSNKNNQLVLSKFTYNPDTRKHEMFVEKKLPPHSK